MEGGREGCMGAGGWGEGVGSGGGDGGERRGRVGSVEGRGGCV